MPDKFPNAASFHTIRVNQPSGWFYTTKSLRQICDICEKYGSGLTNFHGSTGDAILLGTTTENLQPCFDALSEEAGFDLGGSGSALRTLSCCVGPARCNDLTHTFQDEMHRPSTSLILSLTKRLSLMHNTYRSSLGYYKLLRIPSDLYQVLDDPSSN